MRQIYLIFSLGVSGKYENQNNFDIRITAFLGNECTWTRTSQRAFYKTVDSFKSSKLVHQLCKGPTLKRRQLWSKSITKKANFSQKKYLQPGYKWAILRLLCLAQGKYQEYVYNLEWYRTVIYIYHIYISYIYISYIYI